jgi:hypothetical protein
MDAQAIAREDALGPGEKGVLTDEQALVAQAKSVHANAFGDYTSAHQFKIYRSVFHTLRNPQDAEDTELAVTILSNCT